MPQYLYEDEKMLRQAIYDLRRELREDIKEVKEYSKTSFVPLDAVLSMREIEDYMVRKPVKSMDIKDLRKTYKELDYIRGLKSSTLEGAKATGTIYMDDLKKRLLELPKNEQEEFWKMYGQVKRDIPISELFKYDIIKTLDDVYIKSGVRDSRGLTQTIEDMFKISEKYKYMSGDESYDTSIRFTDMLSELQDTFERTIK